MTPALPDLLPDTIERLKAISTATLCTQLFKAGFKNVYLAGVNPVVPGVRMAGEAVTVRYVPAREDLATFESLGDPDHPQRRTIEEFPAGKVLVMPGDIMVGDGDGVVCVPRAVADKIAAAGPGG